MAVVAELPDAFEEALDRATRTLRAEVASARELDTAQRGRFLDWLARRTGRPVEIVFCTDPTLLAGFRVRYEDTMIDSSAGGALGRMRRTLSAARLAATGAVL
jgi:F-type H+-transporting ATPase subunit delta